MSRFHRIILCSSVALGACATLAKTVHYERQGDFPMPDVSGKTPDEAKAALAEAGMVADTEVKDEICADETAVAEQHVCYTTPRAGQPTSSHIPVTIWIKQKAAVFFEMPNLVGLTPEEAKQKLIALGEVPDRIMIET